MHSGDFLIIFAKAPIPGVAKTRLFPHLSFEEAAELQQAVLTDMVDKASVMCRFRVCIAYTPKNSFHMLKSQYGDRVVEFFAQEGTDLGERMHRAFESAFEKGAAKAVIIGADIPSLPPYYLCWMFEKLKSVDLVLGPAADGGYYAVGLKRPVPELFTEMRWSRPDVVSNTMARADLLGLRYELAPPLNDIDTFEDLRGALEGPLPPNTRRLLERLEPRLKHALPEWLT